MARHALRLDVELRPTSTPNTAMLLARGTNASGVPLWLRRVELQLPATAYMGWGWERLPSPTDNLCREVAIPPGGRFCDAALLRYRPLKALLASSEALPASTDGPASTNVPNVPASTEGPASTNGPNVPASTNVPNVPASSNV